MVSRDQDKFVWLRLHEPDQDSETDSEAWWWEHSDMIQSCMSAKGFGEMAFIDGLWISKNTG